MGKTQRKTIDYTIMGPHGETHDLSPSQFSRSLPIRKDSRNVSANLRTLYRLSAQDIGSSQSDHDHSQLESKALLTSPRLPPTPPNIVNGETSTTVEESASDAAAFRSALVTPINQNSPPTPDNTPPQDKNPLVVRPWLGTQASFTSTLAESFTTAQEEITSEPESDHRSQSHDHTFQWPITSVERFGGRLRQKNMAPSPLINAYNDIHDLSQTPDQYDQDPVSVPLAEATTPKSSARSTPNPQNNRTLAKDITPAPVRDVHHENMVNGLTQRASPAQHLRTNSLRERLVEAQSQRPSASTERFANIIGWNNSVPIIDTPHKSQEEIQPLEDTRRFSHTSTTSTIEAFVYDQMPLPKRATTLRHMSKHESLRSVSSPLPSSKRDAINSWSESPHRLIHMKARLSNQNRWSADSAISKSHSIASSAILPKTEIIHVAVIPERSSSLSSSRSNSIKQQSLSSDSSKSPPRKSSDQPPSSWTHKRAFSEALERGREQQQAPVVPVRSSSLSAPTSRTTSRANSISSSHLRVQRQRAEKDLRKTLDRMESDRLLQTLPHWDAEKPGEFLANEPRSQNGHQRKSFGQSTIRSNSLPNDVLTPSRSTDDYRQNALGLVVPGTSEWASLRPSSILGTPFSQPSFQSASPELSEAHAINYFPHNNHSLQLIEPFPVHESKAVLEVQRRGISQLEVESPLRNPRRPPEPPEFQVIPPTPAGDFDHRLVLGNQQALRRADSARRPGGSRRRSESFISAISRNLSVKNPRNRKAGQDLDGDLHPFWRPRAFWDDVDNSRPEPEGALMIDRGIVNNSLGLPQQRTVVTGPASLIRRISERRQQKRGIKKQSSHSSLAKIRAGRRLHKSSSHGLRLNLVSIRTLQDRILHAKQRKEDERREKRRAELRRSIGANVISQGDSRFPASNMDDIPSERLNYATMT